MVISSVSMLAITVDTNNIKLAFFLVRRDSNIQQFSIMFFDKLENAIWARPFLEIIILIFTSFCNQTGVMSIFSV